MISIKILLNKYQRQFQICKRFDGNDYCGGKDQGSCKDLENSGFDAYVGMSAVKNVSLDGKKFCQCEDDFYGASCNQDEPGFKNATKDNCNDNGVFDARNTLTGCSCRESKDGIATEYHGWYCEIHNRLEIFDGDIV